MADTPPGFEPLATPPGFAPLPPAAPSAQPAKGQPVAEGPAGILKGAVRDLSPFGERRPGARGPLDVILKPEGTLENLASLAVKVPAYALVPGGVLGRVALGALEGAATKAHEGKGAADMGWGALLDAAVVGLTEGVGGIAGKLLSKGGKAARAFDYATAAPGKALEAIKARLPAGKWINAPAISSRKITAQEAVEKLAGMKGEAYNQARAELVSELNRLDVQRVTGPKPLAGSVFGHRTSPERFDPSTLSRVADIAAKGARSPVTRGAADAAATTETQGVPLGAIAGAAMMDMPGAIVRRALPQSELLIGGGGHH